jgi:hypothetical protein
VLLYGLWIVARSGEVRGCGVLFQHPQSRHDVTGVAHMPPQQANVHAFEDDDVAIHDAINHVNFGGGGRGQQQEYDR